MYISKRIKCLFDVNALSGFFSGVFTELSSELEPTNLSHLS